MSSFYFFKKFLISSRSGALIKTISWISIISVSIGMAGLVVVASVMNGFQGSIRQRLFGVEPHAIVSYVEQGAEDEDMRLFALASEIQEKFKGKIESLETLHRQDVILRTFEGLFGGGIAKGHTKSTLDQLLLRVERLNKKTTHGPVDLGLGEGDILGEDEVILGVDLARQLQVYEGDEVLLIPPESLLLPPGEAPPFQKVKVKSLIYTRLEDVDAQSIFYNKDHSLNFLNASASLQRSLSLRFKDPYYAANFKEEVSDRKELKVATWDERNEALFLALKLEKFAMTTFLSLAVMITGFSIVSALILLMTQKRKDFGILQAMGLSLVKGQKLFSQIGFSLALCGIVSGAVIGVSISLYLEYFPPDILPAIYYDSSFPAKLDYATVSLIFIFAIGLAWIGTYLPVKSLMKLRPSEALRK